MDINLESDIDTDTLHSGANVILEDNTPDNVINYIKNVELMVQKCRAFEAKRVLFSGIVYSKRITLNILENIHNLLVSLSKNLDFFYIDNRNILSLHIFEDDGLHLLELDKKNISQQFYN